MTSPVPLSAEQRAAIRQRAEAAKAAPNHAGSLLVFAASAKDTLDLLDEIDHLYSLLAEVPELAVLQARNEDLRAELADADQIIRDYDQARQSAVKALATARAEAEQLSRDLDAIRETLAAWRANPNPNSDLTLVAIEGIAYRTGGGS